jgi:hypothetical protein
MTDPVFIEHMISLGQKAAHRVTSEFGQLPTEILNLKPGENSWSIGQCLDHLIISDSLFFPAFEKIKTGAYQMNMVQKWSPLSKFFGNMMEHYISEKVHRKIKSPVIFLPARNEYTPEIIKEFEMHSSTILDYLKSSKETDLDKTILCSRLSRFVTFNLRTAFKMVIHHQYRHINQALHVKKTVTRE